MSQEARQILYQRLQAERGTIRKEAGQVRMRCALAYPNTYFVGMSNLGLQTMYRVINQRPDTVCERVFLPTAAEWGWYGAGKTPLLGLESQRPLGDFDVIGFSVSYENDYLHLLQMLELAHIPLLAAERDERYPLILVGGAVTYINPEPLADFVDLMVVGDGEETIHDYLDLLHDTLGEPRQEHLRLAAEIPGVYVPSLQDQRTAATPITPRKITDLAQWPAYSSVLTDDTEFSGTLLVEITRGCPFKCRFCTVGYVYPKFRQLPGERVLALVAPGLVDLGVAIGISSLRMDRMPEVLVDCMVRSGVRSCTVAPEAGSERLRQLIRKEMTEDVIMAGAEMLLAKGMRDLKLYSMIGLPTETAADLQELLALVWKIWGLMKKYGRARGTLGTLTLSINPFVPKPATPLQWCAMAPPRVIKAKLHTLRQAIRHESHICLKHESVKHDYLEAILARGDRRLRGFLLETHRQHGDWPRAARHLGFDVEAFVCTELSQQASLPWDFLASERQMQRLHREHDRALALPVLAAS